MDLVLIYREEMKVSIAIQVNGEQRLVEADVTVAELLRQLGMHPEAVVVELDMAIVPRAEFGRTRLSAGAQVEIVHFVGGG